MGIYEELISYIRASLEGGVPLERVRQVLTSQGWKEQDIDKAVEFAQTTRAQQGQGWGNEIPRKNYGIIWLFIAIAFVSLLIGGTGIFLVSERDKIETGEKDIFLSENDALNENMIDCGKEVMCFIDAASKCESAVVRVNYKNEIGGIEKTEDFYYELKGKEGDKCRFYIKKEKSSIKYSEDLIKEMLESGISQETINQREKVENTKARKTEGKEGNCNIKINDLIIILESWETNRMKPGEFPASVLEYAQCKGGYFN